jgi:hypothetical protein
MCDDARMEYRYPVGRRVADSLVGLMPILLSAFLIVLLIMAFVDPLPINSHGIRGVVTRVVFSIGLLPAAGLGCAGFALIRKAIGDRLVVTGDGLISREARLISVRATTIPWSSVTSFTVKGLGRSAVVHAILDPGQQVKLSGTARRQVAAAATIAEELTTKLREHHNGDRDDAALWPEG